MKILIVMIMLSILSTAVFADLSIENATQKSFLIEAKNSTEYDINFYHSFYFPIFFTPSSIPLLNNTTSTINLSYPLDYYYGNYTNKIFAVSNSSFDEEDLTIFIPALKNYTLSEYNKTLSLNNNEKGYIKEIINNNGNIELKFSINSTCDFLSFENNFTVLAKTEKELPIYYDIPEDKTSINCNITFDASNILKNFSIDFNISDVIAPIIHSAEINPKSVEANEDIEFELNTTDNIEISTVQVKINNKILNMTKEEDFYVAEWNTLKIGDYNIVFEVLDSSNNKATKEDTLKVTVISTEIISPNTINFYTKKYGEGVKKEMFYSPKEFSIDMTLIDLETHPEDYNLSIMLTLPNTSVIDVSLNEKYVLKDMKEGWIFLKLFSEEEVSFSGKFKIEAPEYLNISKEIKFIGMFTNYSLPEPIEMTMLGAKMNCYVKEEAEELSTYTCEIDYPLDVDINQLVVPVTPESLDIMKQGYEDKINKWKDKQASASFWLWIVIIIYVLSALIASYYVFIHGKWIYLKGR